MLLNFVARISILIVLCYLPMIYATPLSSEDPISVPRPKIVVSIEPLYEIVSSLSHGVVKPIVLYGHYKEAEQALSVWQKSLLLSADIIIRVGRGFETPLDDFLNGQPNLLKNKTITLSQYIPLLEKQRHRANEQAVNFTDRQSNSDLRFWMDPRLIKLLTDIIAPTLALMDPEHLEDYLENEIVLRVQLKKVEQKMMSLFKSLSFEQKLVLAQFNPYLKNRYLSFSDIRAIERASIIEEKIISCLKHQSYTSIPLNLEYTEKALNSLLVSINQYSKTTF